MGDLLLTCLVKVNGGIIMKKILLIDADVVAFKFAKVAEIKGEVLPDGTQLEPSLKPLSLMKHLVDKWYDRLVMDLETPHYVSCISCPAKDLYRYKIRSDYKGNRTDKRPDYLGPLKDYIYDKHNGAIWDNIEADDILGLLAKRYEADGDEPIICSVDKDLRTVGSKMYNFNTQEWYHLSKFQSLRYFYYQCLVGDRVDNYLGCRGIGPAKALPILEKADKEFLKFAKCESFKETETELDCPEEVYEKYLWNAVLETYLGRKNKETNKLYTLDECLEQCRLAYILRNPEDYNQETGEVTLWTDPYSREIL
jgi:5'-3' exonuclease